MTSFAWSVHTTATRQAFAYFDGAARLWEFALGGLLALAVTRVRMPGAVAAPLGWLGVAGLVSCGLVLDVTGTFPGWAALWPLLGASAVILAGTDAGRWGVGRVLGARPFVAVGGVSYALYLVHWPLLVLWLATSGRQRAGASTAPSSSGRPWCSRGCCHGRSSARCAPCPGCGWRHGALRGSCSARPPSSCRWRGPASSGSMPRRVAAPSSRPGPRSRATREPVPSTRASPSRPCRPRNGCRW